MALLADLMGHESIETTRIYLRMTASEQQKILDKVVHLCVIREFYVYLQRNTEKRIYLLRSKRTYQ